MGSEIISLLIWTAVFAYVVIKANKNQGKIEGKIYKFHVFLAWLLLTLHFTGFKMFGWAVGHPKSIFEYFYIPVGPMPASFNLFTWAGNLICSITAILLAFSLAKRKENARIWLLRLIPIIYFFAVTEAIKGFYKGGSESAAPLLAAVSINAVLLAIPFSVIYFFYRNESVKNQIVIMEQKP